ncbi:MAG: hypothetical protein IIW23_02480 [Clostridia bacterium]|nr:hypothetical protein [Clostridia bacterium]
MAEKQSDWKREQARRRRDLLEIKSESAAEPKREEYSAPRTFKEKLANFWYHNKWGVLGAAAVALVLTICVVQFITKPKYDCRVVVYLGSFMDKAASDKLGEELEKYCPDVNGDGEVNVLIIDCCVYSGMQTNQMKNTLDRVQAQLMDPQTTMFIVDDNTIKQLDNTASELFINGDLPALSGRGVNLATTPIGEEIKKADSVGTIKGNFYIAARNFSKNNIIQPAESDLLAAEKIIDNILAEGRE